MKQKAINGRWVIWTTDAIADWDGLTGDPTARRGWEYERMDSMQRHLRYGDTLFDIGTEHGALSAVIAREFVGAENMVLMEPSPEFWPNIRKHWEYNGLNEPRGFWPGFVSNVSSPTYPYPNQWWPPTAQVHEPETAGMAYRSLTDAGNIPSITIDDYVKVTGIIPTALNIDVEGAELLVLEGADTVLRQHRPKVWVSIHPDLLERDFGATKSELMHCISRVGYTAIHLATDHEEHYLLSPL